MRMIIETMPSPASNAFHPHTKCVEFDFERSHLRVLLPFATCHHLIGAMWRPDLTFDLHATWNHSGGDTW